MSIDGERLEHLERFLMEALEAIQETKEHPEPAAAPVRQALALTGQLADEAKPERWDVSHPNYRRPPNVSPQRDVQA